MRISGSHFSTFLPFDVLGNGERRYKDIRADVVLDFVSAVWAYVVVFDPVDKLLIENSRTIC